jgi:phosphotransferase system HPr-like phosphotransfer protein
VCRGRLLIVRKGDEIKMKRFKIVLSSIEDVKNFTAIMNKETCDADIVSGKYVVDAKSIMGIFSLDLSKPLELAIHSDDVKETEVKIQKYIVSKIHN